MSSKLNVKQGKKDRPKSSDRMKGKRRDCTPDKSATPPQEAQDENRPPSRHIIWDEEIEQLQIKPEDLEKMRVPAPPDDRPMVTSKLTVRKMKPASELNKAKMKNVKVARPASPDAELKQVDNSGYAGPRYDAAGRVIHYSILGTFEDFRREALNRGDLLDIPTPRINEAYTKDQLTVKYEKKKKRAADAGRKRMEENNALRNWQKKMIERKRQQGYISKLLQKALEDLVMNQADGYRKTQEDRYLIDRTIPFMDYGKGYRVGSEFWKQQEPFGDELTGVHMSLTQSERGYPAPVEFVGVPSTVQDEKGIQWEPEYRTPSHHPWHSSSYLQHRRKQLQPIMDELTSHKPDFAGLQVIGTNKPQHKTVEKEEDSEDGMDVDDAQDQLNEAGQQKAPDVQDPFHEYPDVRPPPVFGPSLQFAGQTAGWTGDSNSCTGQVGIEARVTFEAATGSRVTSHLELVNNGTTSVFFDWKKLPRDNPFDLAQAPVQHFYFNNSSGVILPGETLHFPFVFKSECAGVFTEQWLLETCPVLCGGAALVLTLRGVALEEDRFQQQRVELERDLETKQLQQAVIQILENMVAGIRTPQRCPSPVDAYITEEEIFERNNPGLSYRHEAVTEMKRIHLQLVPEEEKDSTVWDLCVIDLKDMIMELDEDDERKEPLLTQLNSLASILTFDLPQPVCQSLHNLCHKLLSEAVDSMVTQASLIRQTMGISAREMGDIMEDSQSMEKRDSRGGSKRSRTATVSDSAGRVRSSNSRKGTRPTDKGKADASKDKKPAAGAAKDAKSGKAGKETPKPDPKAKAPTPSVAKKGTPSKPPGGGGVPEPRTSTPTSPPHTPDSQEQEEVMERKYREKLYTQMYSILQKKMDQMERFFQHDLSTSS